MSKPINHYTHKQTGGVFNLIDDSIVVQGLSNTTLVQIKPANDKEPLIFITSQKWQREYRQLLPLECYYCGGTGKDPAKSSMPCGYCFGSSLLDINGDAITKCDKTSDQLLKLISTLRQTINHQAATIGTLRSLPGVTQLEKQASLPSSKDVYPDNNRGPGGSKFCGD